MTHRNVGETGEVVSGKEFGKGGSKLEVNLPQAIEKKRNELKANIAVNLPQSSKKPDKAKSVGKNFAQAIAKRAKENQGTRNDICQKSDKSIDTKKEVAKIAGVSHDTIHRVEVRIGELLKQKKLSVP